MNPFNKPQIELIKSFGDKNVLESYKGVDIQEYYKKTYNTEPPVEAYAEEVEFQEMNTGKARKKLAQKVKESGCSVINTSTAISFQTKLNNPTWITMQIDKALKEKLPFDGYEVDFENINNKSKITLSCDKDLLKDVVKITNKTLKKINDELVNKVQIKKEDFKDLSDYFLHIKDCGDYNKASKMLEKLNIKTPKNKI